MPAPQRTVPMTADDDAAMWCVVCHKRIVKDSGHYRITEKRIHVECLQAFWRKLPPAITQRRS